MNIFEVINFGGFIICRTPSIGVVSSTCNDFSYKFQAGVYLLIGDIDSGGWAFSSAILQIKKKSDVILSNDVKFNYMNKITTLDQIRENTCAIDYRPQAFFQKKFSKSVYCNIRNSLKISKLDYSVKEIQDLFCLDSQRINRPLYCAGHEVFRSNAAIGFALGKTIFCFPWISRSNLLVRKNDIKFICDTLISYNKVVLLPLSYIPDSFNNYEKIIFPS